MKSEVYEFPSVTAYLDAIKPDPVNGASHSPEDPYDGGWYKTNTFAEAMALARNGWTEGAALVAPLVGRLVSRISGRILREDWVPSVEGAFFDIGRYCAGDPEHWVRPEENWGEGSARKHIRIMCMGGASGGVSADVYQARGAAVAALCDLLEIAGDVVTLEQAFSNRAAHGLGGDPSVTSRYVLKQADENADLSKLMFFLAHPSSLRRINFGFREGLSPATRAHFGFAKNTKGSYGQSVNVPEDGYDVFLPAAHLSSVYWQSIEATNKWLIETLRKVGVRLADSPETY